MLCEALDMNVIVTPFRTEGSDGWLVCGSAESDHRFLMDFFDTRGQARFVQKMLCTAFDADDKRFVRKAVARIFRSTSAATKKMDYFEFIKRELNKALGQAIRVKTRRAA